MEYSYEYNPVTDLMATVEGLSCDLEVAINTGVVVDTGSLGEYNDITDPTNILCRVHDAFEAIDLQKRARALHSASVAAAQAAEVAASAASATPSGANE